MHSIIVSKYMMLKLNYAKDLKKNILKITKNYGEGTIFFLIKWTSLAFRLFSVFSRKLYRKFYLSINIKFY